jgi:hypothetical protein
MAKVKKVNTSVTTDGHRMIVITYFRVNRTDRLLVEETQQPEGDVDTVNRWEFVQNFNILELLESKHWTYEYT